jgi:DNA-binding GntR family transcriptional regulator
MTKDTRPAVQKMRDVLEDEIVDGKLKPGEQLDVAKLAERFGVSRTPTREALQQLAATGLVEVQPKRGTFVAKIGLPQLIEMFEVMAELEGMCGRLCARRITRDELAELEKALEACQRAAQEGEPDSYYYENARFHDIIYQGCHNSFLVQHTKQLRARLEPYRRLQLRVRNRVGKSVEEHEAIVAAIRASDEALAEHLLREHILIQGERFSDFVASIAGAPELGERKTTSVAVPL